MFLSTFSFYNSKSTDTSTPQRASLRFTSSGSTAPPQQRLRICGISSSEKRGRTQRSVDDEDEGRKVTRRRLATEDTTTNAADKKSKDPPSVYALLKQLSKRPEHAVQKALEALADMCSKDEPASNERRQDIVASGGPVCVVVAMENHDRDAGIVAAGCRVLTNMSFRDPPAKERIAAAGGIDAILDAMHRFPASEHVQRTACGALANLSRDFAHNQNLIRDAGGLELVHAAAQTFPENETLQEWAKWCIMHCCVSTDSAAAVADGANDEQQQQQQYRSYFCNQQGCGILW